MDTPWKPLGSPRGAVTYKGNTMYPVPMRCPSCGKVLERMAFDGRCPECDASIYGIWS